MFLIFSIPIALNDFQIFERNKKRHGHAPLLKFYGEEEREEGEEVESKREEGFEGVKVASRVSAVEQVPRVGPRVTAKQRKAGTGKRNVVSNEARAKSNETAACTAAACSI